MGFTDINPRLYNTSYLIEIIGADNYHNKPKLNSMNG